MEVAVAVEVQSRRKSKKRKRRRRNQRNQNPKHDLGRNYTKYHGVLFYEVELIPASFYWFTDYTFYVTWLVCDYACYTHISSG